MVRPLVLFVALVFGLNKAIFLLIRVLKS